MSSSSSSCCPPNSWGAPLDPSGPPTTHLGTLVTVGSESTPAYYTTGNPTNSNSSHKRGIIVFPDVFGLAARTKSVCDTFAMGGCQVIVFDPFRGETMVDHKDNFVGWISQYPFEPNIENDVQACIDFLVTKGVDRSRIGAMGFCWGAWAIAKASNSIDFKCAAWAHPSTGIETRVFHGDEKAMMEGIRNIPILSMPAGNDDERHKKGGEFYNILQSKGGNIVEFPNMTHGWTIRSDMSVPETRKDAEHALTLAFEWFAKWL